MANRPIRVNVPLWWVVRDRLDRETEELLIVVMLRAKALLPPAMVCTVLLNVITRRVLLVALVVVILVSRRCMACMIVLVRVGPLVLGPVAMSVVSVPFDRGVVFVPLVSSLLDLAFGLAVGLLVTSVASIMVPLSPLL